MALGAVAAVTGIAKTRPRISETASKTTSRATGHSNVLLAISLIRGLVFAIPVTGRDGAERHRQAIKPILLESATDVLGAAEALVPGPVRSPPRRATEGGEETMQERSLHAKGAENDAASPAESAAPPSNFNHLMERQPTLGDLGFEEAPRDGAEGAPAPHRDLASLADGDRIEGCYVVRERSRRPTKRGGEWLSLKLSDRSKTIGAKAFDDVPALFDACAPGTIVHVRARFESSPQWGDALIVEGARAASEHEYDAGALLESSPIPLARLEEDLRALLETIRTPDLAELLARFFSPGTAVYERFRDAPAAKHYHQAYRHGLLEHALTVAQSSQRRRLLLRRHRPRRRRDWRAPARRRQTRGLQRRPARASTSPTSAAYKVTSLSATTGCGSEIERIEGFEPSLAQAVLHIILSHHGSLEHGSPGRPGDARGDPRAHDGQPRRPPRQLRPHRAARSADGEAWSGFDRGIGGGAYFLERDKRAARSSADLLIPGGAGLHLRRVRLDALDTPQELVGAALVGVAHIRLIDLPLDAREVTVLDLVDVDLVEAALLEGVIDRPVDAVEGVALVVSRIGLTMNR